MATRLPPICRRSLRDPDFQLPSSKMGDYTLNKGVSLWQDNHNTVVPIVHDIGHAAANILKKEFETNGPYLRFIAMINQGAKCLRQTDLAFLTPPKLRGKGRFLSISTSGKWAAKIIEVLAIPKNRKSSPILTKLREVLPGFHKLKRNALLTRLMWLHECWIFSKIRASITAL